MTRHTVVGLLLVGVMVLAGRVIRHQLMLGPDQRWREPGWLADQLPQPTLAVAPPVRKLSGKLSINSCDEDSLVLLPGVGPVLAGRIAEARAAGVHFARPKDLCRVRGIGPVLSERLAVHVRFDRLSSRSGALSTLDSLPQTP